MGDNLLESYNPLYDVHLRQYFALPHMQKHLRSLGLLDGTGTSSSDNNNEQLHAGHVQMMDMMLRNRERVLQQLMDLQRKLDAAEKVELYRRIRSGITCMENDEQQSRSHMSRSLSRPARSAPRSGGTGDGRRRRQSLSPEAGDLLIKRVETDYRSDSAPFRNPKSIYNRLAANVYKYQYLHKLDDRTLHKYMNSLRRQLAKLERFREVSFGPHTMAKHAPAQLQQSWFFRRRSLPSLDNPTGANHHHPPHAHERTQTNAAGSRSRSLKSGQSRKSRSGKSQSPQRISGGVENEPPNKMQRTSASRPRGTHRLPPLPGGPLKKRSFPTSRTTPTKLSEQQRLPPTAVIRPTRKVPQEQQPARRVPPPPPSIGKKTPSVGSRPASKGSTTPVPVQKKPPSAAGTDVLPAIGAAVAGTTIGAGIASMLAAEQGGREEENRESGAPSPSISLAASQTTTTDGGQLGADSEWEGEQQQQVAAGEVNGGGTETRPTPEHFFVVEQERITPSDRDKEAEGEEEAEAEDQLTARPSLHSEVQSPEDELPPEEPEPPKDAVMEERNEEVNSPADAEEEEVEEPKLLTEPEEADDTVVQRIEAVEEPIEEVRPPTMAGVEQTTYPDEMQSLDKAGMESPVLEAEEQHPEDAHPEFEVKVDEIQPAEDAHSDRFGREVPPFMEGNKPEFDEESLNYFGKQEWTPREESANEEEGQAEEPMHNEQIEEENLESPTLNAAESDQIRQFSHPNVEIETGPEESVRSLASSSIEGSLQREEELKAEERQEEQQLPKANEEVEQPELWSADEQVQQEQQEEPDKEEDEVLADHYERQTPVEIRNWDGEQVHVLDEEKPFEDEGDKDRTGNEVETPVLMNETEQFDEEGEGNRQEQENPADGHFAERVEMTVEETQAEGKNEESEEETHSEQRDEGQPEEEQPREEVSTFDEQEFVRVKREESGAEQSELVESEPVQTAGEDGSGRKLSESDAQLEFGSVTQPSTAADWLQENSAEIDQQKNIEEELVSSTPLDEPPREPIAETVVADKTGEDQAKPEEITTPTGEKQYTDGIDETHHEGQENVPNGITPPPGQETNEHENNVAYGIDASEENQTLLVGDAGDTSSIQADEEPETFSISREQWAEAGKITPEHEAVDLEQQHDEQQREAPPLESPAREQTVSRPATAEALLSQPSIEITPASEYGGSVEDNRDAVSMVSSQPASPMLKEEANEENLGEENENQKEQQQAFQSSPVANEENDQNNQPAHEDLNETHPHQQNGHNAENGGEPTIVQQENERTSLLGKEEEGSSEEGNGCRKKSGGSGGMSSDETEGADEESEEGDQQETRPLIYGHLDNGQLPQHFQSVKLEPDDKNELNAGHGQM